MATGAAAPPLEGAGVTIAHLWFAAAGLFSTVFGRMLMYKSIQGIGVARTAAASRLNPFFAVLLAALLLGETIGPAAGAGMMIIGASFVLLVSAAFPRLRKKAGDDGAERRLSPGAYAFGPGAALCYACGNVSRKAGLLLIPDAVYGALVSAVTAGLYYAAAVIISEDARRAAHEALTAVNHWQLGAALLVSTAQIAMFLAIQFTTVSRAVMILSVEVFLSILLASYVFRIETPPEGRTLVAALLATLGVVLVAA